MTVAQQLAAYPQMAGECGFVLLHPGYAASIAYLERCFDGEYGKWLEGQQESE